jgi:outer membrane protein OmpA-like peptidoglycan-associated protein
VTIFKVRSYSAVLLQGNATVPNSASNKNLAKARALAVEAYMKKLGVKVTFSIEATVSGSTAKYSVVFVQAK